MTVVIGPLVERGRRRLLVGVTAVYRPRGMTCELALGTLVRVTCQEHEGIRTVETIKSLPEPPTTWRRLT
jgi:hypothetical protein